MKKLLVLFVVLLTLSLGITCAQAATVVERLGALEAFVGFPPVQGTLVDRISYLESQMGIIPAADATLDDRMTVMENVLGIVPAEPVFDNGTYAETTSLTSLEPFDKSGRVDTPNYETYHHTDNYGNVYTDYIGSGKQESSIEYRLDEPYHAFSATLYVSAPSVKEGYNHSWETATISIYGDDVLLYTVTGTSKKAEPIDILLDITDVKFLKIQFDNACYYSNGIGCSLLAVGNPLLLK